MAGGYCGRVAILRGLLVVVLFDCGGFELTKQGTMPEAHPRSQKSCHRMYKVLISTVGSGQMHTAYPIS
jgi:hypothetical protein